MGLSAGMLPTSLHIKPISQPHCRKNSWIGRLHHPTDTAHGSAIAVQDKDIGGVVHGQTNPALAENAAARQRLVEDKGPTAGRVAAEASATSGPRLQDIS